jgi:hypothetical protein
MSGLTAGEGFLKSLLNWSSYVTANGSRTATLSLSGTLTPLLDYKCKAVILLSECNLATGNGDTIELLSPPLLLPCNNASEILVSGSGTLSYLILL